MGLYYCLFEMGDVVILGINYFNEMYFVHYFQRYIPKNYYWYFIKRVIETFR